MHSKITAAFILFSCTAIAHPGINDIPSAPHGAWYFQPIIGGIMQTCRAYNGQPVAVFSDHLLNDVGAANFINSQWVIFMNPHVLLNLPNENQLFWYLHECAHVSLPTRNEDVADCAAVKYGRNNGWITPQGIHSICTYFQGNPGDWTHSPGHVRCQNMSACYQTP